MSFNITTETNPDWLNKGDNAWQLTAASLVGLQSIPGLVIIYAGKFDDNRVQWLFSRVVQVSLRRNGLSTLLSCASTRLP
jgi:hypothetical protein